MDKINNKQPSCKVCGKPLSLNNSRKTYPEFCSKKCIMDYNKNPILYENDIQEASEKDLDEFIKNNCEIKKVKDNYIVNLSLKYKLFMNVDLSLVTYVKSRWPWVSSIKEAIHCYLNKIDEQPRCIQCGEPTMFSGKNADYGYQQFCSDKCIQDFDQVWAQDKNKIKEFIKTFYFQENMTKASRKLCNESKMRAAGFIDIMNAVKKAVPFAKDLTEAMYAYYYDIKTRPVCANCGNEVRFVDVKTGYKRFCSATCSLGGGESRTKKPEKLVLKSKDDVIEFVKTEYFKDNGSPKDKWCKDASINSIIKDKQELESLYLQYPWTKASERFLELAHCVKNDINKQPSCPVCGKPVKYSFQNKQYNKFCSKECSYVYNENPLKYIDVANIKDKSYYENIFKEFINEHANIQPDGRVFMDNKYQKFSSVDNNILKYIKLSFPWVTSIREAVYCYVNNINEQPLCKVCSRKIDFSKIKGSYGYSNFCSIGCMRESSDNKYLYSLSKAVQNNFFDFLEKHKNKHFENHTLNTLATLLNVPKTILPRWLKKYNITVSEEPVHRSGLEISMQEFLDSINIEYQSNNRKILEGLELDFYVPEHKIAIEMHGKRWHSTEFLKKRTDNTKKYHYIKFTKAREKDILLYQVHDFQWNDPYKQEIWKSRIATKLGAREVNTIYARKCEIREVPTKDAREFLEASHLDGYINSSIKIGLYYNNELVSIMTFGKNRFKKTDENESREWELYRYASKQYTRVTGGASKMLKYFIKNYTTRGDILISFSNNDISDGNVYRKLGFEYAGNTESYFYIDKKNNIYNRMRVQKHKLPSLLGISEDELEYKTADEILFEHDIYKIYTSGQSKWQLCI